MFPSDSIVTNQVSLLWSIISSTPPRLCPFGTRLAYLLGSWRQRAPINQTRNSCVVSLHQYLFKKTNICSEHRHSQGYMWRKLDPVSLIWLRQAQEQCRNIATLNITTVLVTHLALRSGKELVFIFMQPK